MIQSDRARRQKTFWLRWPFWVTAIPLGMLLCSFLWLVIREIQASDRVAAELARIETAGQPTGNASLARWFSQHTHREGTTAWSEILALAVRPWGGPSEQLPYVGPAAEPRQLDPQQPWPEQQVVGEYLRWMRPVIEQIHQANEYPVPVWQPVQFRGYLTQLEELHSARGVIRLLCLDVEHALYQGDSTRALRSLAAMRRTADAFDWQFAVVADLVPLTYRKIHQAMVRRSLSVDHWKDEQLRALAEQLAQPRELPQRWQRVVAGERAFASAAGAEQQYWLDENQTWIVSLLMRIPSGRESILMSYRRLESLGDSGVEALVEHDWNALYGDLRHSPWSILMPSFTSYARAIEREEDSRRFALTAVAIKRFQRHSGHWPEHLSQLQQVGLDSADWTTVSGGRFGYQVQDDAVLLWSYEPHDQTRVSSAPPQPEREGDDLSDLLITIR